MTPSKDPPVHPNLPEHLADGYAKFRDGRLRAERDRFRHLADAGQKPPVLLIGCCDSRVAPEVIFEAGPGEIFVVRNIGALVPPFSADGAYAETACAIEYAVLALRVAHVVVMGHAQCGAIRAFALGETDAFTPLSEANFVARWTALIGPAAARLQRPGGDLDHHCESLGHASVIQSLANLRTYPWLKAREDEGLLTLHGAYFGVGDGQVTALDQARGTFVPVVPRQ